MFEIVLSGVSIGHQLLPQQVFVALDKLLLLLDLEGLVLHLLVIIVNGLLKVLLRLSELFFSIS